MRHIFSLHFGPKSVDINLIIIINIVIEILLYILCFPRRIFVLIFHPVLEFFTMQPFRIGPIRQMLIFQPKLLQSPIYILFVAWDEINFLEPSKAAPGQDASAENPGPAGAISGPRTALAPRSMVRVQALCQKFP